MAYHRTGAYTPPFFPENITSAVNFKEKVDKIAIECYIIRV